MAGIVFITGASSGIGEACAEIFAQNRYHIILNGRREERLRKQARQLEGSYGVKTYCLPFDVRRREEVNQAISSLPAAWQAIDVLINNAGLALGLDPLPGGDPDDWEVMIDTNIKGLLYVTRAVTPYLLQSTGKQIINIGSIAGKEVYPNGGVYCASKHAVDALSRGMRIDMLSRGIKVSAIHPGAVETEFSIVRFKGDAARAAAVYEGFVPLTAEDIAETAYFVASRPAHVNIDDLMVMPAAQAGATRFNRK